PGSWSAAVAALPPVGSEESAWIAALLAQLAARVAQWLAERPGSGAALPVPPALWGRPSGLRCLDEVVRSVWDEGWSHHITRLMVIGNLMTLLGVSPRALADWFWVAYVDAYDWVVEPNVLAMATFGTDRLTTKPYVSGAAYLARMGDYCRGCRFDPKRDCPVTPMYWAFLAEHAALLGRNPRVSGPVASALRRDQATRARDRQVLERVRARLLAGEVVEGGGLFG
ncbi:MAG TPA: FAD-binding domain-containing protein, partial [Myxococcota bacterium]|nr:FAD-binding domain-containing protein [Myxococcota bacterium]